eukprot:1721006-Amphidinium_carterae.1
MVKIDTHGSTGATTAEQLRSLHAPHEHQRHRSGVNQHCPARKIHCQTELPKGSTAKGLGRRPAENAAKHLLVAPLPD